MFAIVSPLSLISISIFVFVYSRISLIIFEDPLKVISIEKSNNPLKLKIILPDAFEYSALAKVIDPLSFFLPLLEVACVPIFIGEL